MSRLKQPTTEKRWSRWWPLALPAVVVTVSLVTLWLTTNMREQMVADRLAERLVSAEGPQVRVTIQAIAKLDESGIATLVRLLDSDNPAVATVVKQTLDQQLEIWRVRGVDHWSPRVAVFAAALAEQMEPFRPAARQQAAEYAAELLQWQTADDAVDRVDYLIACDKVLHAANTARVAAPAMESRPLPPAESHDATVAAIRKPGADAMQASSMNEQIERFASLPGGGLPVDVTVISDLPTRSDLRTANAPRTLDPREEARPIEREDVTPLPASLPTTESAPSTSGKRASTSSLQWKNTRQVVDQQPAEGATVDEHAPSLLPIEPREALEPQGENEPTGPHAKATVGLSTYQVIEQLNKNDQTVELVVAAERELVRRGLNSLELQLARQLANGDIQSRRQTVASLPRLAGINTRRWLLLLTEDEDADVRLSAYRWLVTMSDVVTLKNIRRSARQDQDLRIRRLAAEMAGDGRRLR